MYDIEKYYQAEDVDDAVRALSADLDTAMILGDSDVLIEIRERRLAGRSLVNIHGIRELRGISMEEDGTIVIGPVTIFSHVTNNKIVQECIPILGDAVDMVGGPQLRSIGTVGGNVCSGVAGADGANSFCCLDAILTLTGPTGARGVSVSEWYIGLDRAVKTHDEFLTSVKIKKEDYEGYSGHYIKHGRRGAMEITTLGYAVTVKLSEGKKYIEDLRLGYGVAAPTPIRYCEAEQSMIDMETRDTLAEKVGKEALSKVGPRSSQKTPKKFRLRLVEELGKRAVKQAVINTGSK